MCDVLKLNKIVMEKKMKRMKKKKGTYMQDGVRFFYRNLPY